MPGKLPEDVAGMLAGNHRFRIGHLRITVRIERGIVPRGTARRIISMRNANEGEVEKYAPAVE